MARIFNTFGPRMHFNDGVCVYVRVVCYKTDFTGRVVSNFIIQALQNKNLTVSMVYILCTISTIDCGIHPIVVWHGISDQIIHVCQVSSCKYVKYVFKEF